MNAKTLSRLLLAIVLSGATVVSAVEPPIQIAIEGAKSAPQFNIGDSRCVLVDDQIRCTPITK
jgi:hypothetical protein